MNKVWLTQAIEYHRKKNVNGSYMLHYIHDLGFCNEMEFILQQLFIDWKEYWW